jgi:NitT/TauT family transport system ATP-binding protein
MPASSPLLTHAEAADSAPATLPAHLEITRLSKTFPNGARVLENVSLRIAPGEFVSLIGPSGCGKSTVLKLVSGLTQPSAGSILVEGRTPANARDAMSFIFQDATLLPWRTVTQNVSLGLELENVARARQAEIVPQLLAFVGLEKVGDRYPRQLSGGMKMRVSIARALATTPRLLLMDEPFGALDEMTRDRLNEELLRLRERDRWTAVFVTHSVAEAVFLSNRIIVLGANPGRVVHDLPVPFPYPRDDALRGSEAFQRTVVDVSVALRQAAHMKGAA